MMSRAYVEVDGRLVHFRHAGSGSPILLVHQSPKSSAEFDALIQRWAMTNLVIAPDTPGFGQSDPLADAEPDVTDFAEALIGFLDALKIAEIAVYGFHSGAVFAVEAAKIAPNRFTAVACNGYAVWTDDEIRAFGEKYLPPFTPQAYGEHLTWLWARMREQRFFFPWYDVTDAHRMKLPAASPDHLHANAMDMLYARDNYRIGYGAVVRAKRDVPTDDRAVPTLIVSFEGDPLQAHLTRLGKLPHNWRIEACATQADTERAAKVFLDAHSAPALVLDVPSGMSRQFVDGVHVVRRGEMRTLLVHAPGSSGAAMLEAFCGADAFAIDLPGHGLTSKAFVSLEETVEILTRTLGILQVHPAEIIADNLSMPLALLLIASLSPEPALQVIGYRDYSLAQIGQLKQSYLTDVTPDSNGFHLLHAWRRVRDSCLFDPWFDNGPEAVRQVDDAALVPQRLAVAHLAAVQATGGPAMLDEMIRIYEKEKRHGNS